MMKILFWITWLLLLIVGGMTGYALYLGAEARYTTTVTIDAPPTVVWNTLSRLERPQPWLKDKTLLYNYDHTSRQVQWSVGEKTLLINQQVRIREAARAIDFLQIGDETYSLLEHFDEALQLTPLADGATEVRWSYHYRLPGLSARLLNHWVYGPLFQQSLRQSALRFKQFMGE